MFKRQWKAILILAISLPMCAQTLGYKPDNVLANIYNSGTGTWGVWNAILAGYSGAVPGYSMRNVNLWCQSGTTIAPCSTSGSGTSYFPGYGTLAPSTPPLAASLTWFNQGTATANDTNGLNILSVGGASASLNALVTTLPATPYNFTIAMRMSCANVTCNIGTSVNLGGITVKDSTGKQVVVILANVNGVWDVDFQTYNNNTFNAVYTSLATGTIPAGSQIWLRLKDDGTNFTAYYSFDGSNFWQVGSPQLRTAYLTAPSAIGVVVNDQTNSTVTAQNVFIPYWKLQ